MAKVREFPLTAIQRAGDDSRQSGFVVTCSCGTTESVISTGHIALPPPMVKKKFEQKGWFIGSRPEDDRCPAHAPVSKRRRRSEKPQEEEKVPTTATRRNTQLHLPTTMSFTERRLIIAKLQDIYLDEILGYADGWSDKTVAADLGVPVDWVADIRSANFGPAKINAEVREFFEKVDAVAADVAAVAAEAEKASAAVNGLSIMVQELLNTAKALKDQLL